MDSAKKFSIAGDCFTHAAASLPSAVPTSDTTPLLSIRPAEQEATPVNSLDLLEYILNTKLVEPIYLQQISNTTLSHL